MYEDNQWNAVTGEELEGFLSQVNPIDQKLTVSPSTATVEWRQLPWYDSVAMIRVRDESWTQNSLTIYYLTDAGTLYRLNGTSPPIHDINAKAPIKITDDNVLEYLRFFCFFVRGEEGPFLIAEDLNNPNMPPMDEKMKTVIGGAIRPASFEGKNEQGHWLCDAVVFYSNALFIANFAVHPTGMIEMLDDEPIAADLTVRVDKPVALDQEGNPK
ncbi:MAG: hypothetical protein CL565_00995 [Alphaproteobacteria bacterium]|nr:hypothetical protein [Alphaproteobacteria bacterium]